MTFCEKLIFPIKSWADKKLKDILKITAAGRYDKNENFEGRFTPRVTGTIKVAKNNYIQRHVK